MLGAKFHQLFYGVNLLVLKIFLWAAWKPYLDYENPIPDQTIILNWSPNLILRFLFGELKYPLLKKSFLSHVLN